MCRNRRKFIRHTHKCCCIFVSFQMMIKLILIFLRRFVVIIKSNFIRYCCIYRFFLFYKKNRFEFDVNTTTIVVVVVSLPQASISQSDYHHHYIGYIHHIHNKYDTIFINSLFRELNFFFFCFHSQSHFVFRISF